MIYYVKHCSNYTRKTLNDMIYVHKTLNYNIYVCKTLNGAKYARKNIKLHDKCT